MKMLCAIVILSILSVSTTSGFRFGTLYTGLENIPPRKVEVVAARVADGTPTGSVVYYPRNAEANANILKYDSDHDLGGNYNYEYETENKIRAVETGVNDNGENVVRGSYSYVGPDGVTYTTNYIADRYGYRATGAHLPTQPDEVDPLALRKFYTVNREYHPVTSRYYPSSTIVPPLIHPSVASRFYPTSTFAPPALLPSTINPAIAARFYPTSTIAPPHVVPSTLSPLDIVPPPNTFLLAPFRSFNYHPSLVSGPAEAHQVYYSSTIRPIIASSTPGTVRIIGK